MITASEQQYLENQLPNTTGTPCSKTSERTPKYNCLAHALHIDNKWWWPDKHGFWPIKKPIRPTLDSFKVMLALESFEVSDNYDLESGYEKIAIFADDAGVPKHAARQLDANLWTSKLGEWIDISHPLRSVEGQKYGKVAFVMKKKLVPQPASPAKP